MLAEVKENSGHSASTNKQDESRDSRATSLVEIVLDMASRELTKHKELKGHQREHYSVAKLCTEVLRIETGLPTKEVLLHNCQLCCKIQGAYKLFFLVEDRGNYSGRLSVRNAVTEAK